MNLVRRFQPSTIAGTRSSTDRPVSGQVNYKRRHKTLQVFQRTSMPDYRLRRDEIKVDACLITGFNNEAGQHRDSGTVQEIELFQIEHHRVGRVDQRLFQKVQNRQVIRHPLKSQRPFKKDRGVVIFHPYLKRLARYGFHFATLVPGPGNRTALVVTTRNPGYLG
jgi:hypothetical protein